jgi:hypothetical protein
MSYAHFDDDHDHQWLSKFIKRLSAEVRSKTGVEFPIFQERDDITWGEHWQSRIEETLYDVPLFIPILTPSYFKSKGCRAELQRFLQNERDRGRQDLVLPLHYVTVDELEDEAKRAADTDMVVLASRQIRDVRRLRGKDLKSATCRKVLETLAEQLKNRSAVRPATAPQQPKSSPSTTGHHVPTTTPPGQIGTWEGLARTLRQTTLDNSNWRALASSSSLLVHELALIRPPHLSDDEELDRLVRKLERGLAAGMQASASPEVVRAATSNAARLQGWLLQRLTGSGS